MDYKIQKIALITSLVMVSGIAAIILISKGMTKNIQPEEMGPDSDKKIEVLSGQIGDDLYAYLEDEAFFNQEESVLEQLITQSKKIVLRTVSVEKDMRIFIEDYKGKLVTGSEFRILLSDGKEYVDENKDGMIEISYLTPREYEVILQPIDDYIVPAESSFILVKESVQYTRIEDIQLSVLEENQVTNGADKTMFMAAQNAASDAQITEIEGIKEKNTVGVSLSSRNENVDFDLLYENGIDFVMLRAGYRGNATASIIADDKFEEYAKEAVKAGLVVGAFFESQAVTKVEAVEEASFVLAQIEGNYITYPIFIDMQGCGDESRNASLSKEMKSNIVVAFSETIKSEGFESGLYAASTQLVEEYNLEEIESYHTWMGQYQQVPNYSQYYSMWQLTASGKVEGINELVKINISY